MMSKISYKLLILPFLIGTVVSLENICLDRKTVCQTFETCVTFERGCSLGANCLEPGVFEKSTECIEMPVKLPILPKKSLCKQDEVFARSVDKGCYKRPCPLRLGYNCYPIRGTAPTCKGIKCPFGTHCEIGESCNDLLCEPKANCRVNTA